MVGRKLGSIFSDLFSDKRGRPTLPDRVPPAEETFSQMSFDDHWQDAQVVAVCHWLWWETVRHPAKFQRHYPQKVVDVSILLTLLELGPAGSQVAPKSLNTKLMQNLHIFTHNLP
jgi:hypothetical protein